MRYQDRLLLALQRARCPGSDEGRAVLSFVHPGCLRHCPALPPATCVRPATYRTALGLYPQGTVGLGIISRVVQVSQYAPSCAPRLGVDLLPWSRNSPILEVVLNPVDSELGKCHIRVWMGCTASRARAKRCPDVAQCSYCYTHSFLGNWQELLCACLKSWYMVW